MGIFVDYPSNPFANLANTPTTLLTTGLLTDPHVLVVNSIIVCNTGAQAIRFNLQKVRTQNPNPSVTIFYTKEFEVKAYQTVDIVTALGLQIFLEYKVAPAITDALICFSNSPTQKFDCEITYTRLNETPLTL
jgi:hypothetical protein